MLHSLSNNHLCGVWEEYEHGRGRGQKGTYDASGITAIAEALTVNAVLTSLDVSSNNLTDATYVNVTKLPGDNYKSGDMVKLEGRELKVLKEMDSDGNVLLGTVVGVDAIE